MNIQVADVLPLRMDCDGVIRVGGTRVTLDTLVEAFAEGSTPEQMVQQYPSLELPDVYATIAWYLRHRVEAEQYVRGRREKAEQVRSETESRHDPTGIRERLLARRSGTGQ